MGIPVSRTEGEAAGQALRAAPAPDAPGFVAVLRGPPGPLAFWAFAMGLMLALVAALSGGGAA